MKRIASIALASMLTLGTAGAVQATTPQLGAAQASAPTLAMPMKTFTSCKALNKKYAHGVGRKGAKDKTSGIPVKNFKRSKKLYKRYSTSSSKGRYYRDLDRDNDGIACEKR